MKRLVAFRLDGQRYAVHLDSVARVVRAVAPTRLPKAPEIVLGLISMAGDLAPLVDLRRRFGHPLRDIDLDDQIIFARTPRRLVALPVDGVDGVVEANDGDVVNGAAVLKGLEEVEGVVKLDDDLVLIYDLDRCLSLDEERALDDALQETG